MLTLMVPPRGGTHEGDKRFRKLEWPVRREGGGGGVELSYMGKEGVGEKQRGGKEKE